MNAGQFNSTIVAQATPAGKSAIAIVRLSGQMAREIALQIIHKDNLSKSMQLCDLYDLGGERFDQALVLFFQKPKSFSGEDMVEFHTHGNPLIVEILIETCLSLGARLAQPGEFSQRAFLNQKIDLVQAEAIKDMIEASSQNLLRASLRQFSGQLTQKLQKLINDLSKASALAQGALDFPIDTAEDFQEEEVKQLVNLSLHTLERLLSSARSSYILREGLGIAIVGRPNAGKSSLLNALLDNDRAIVSSRAGTTRDFLEESLLVRDIPVRLVDTAGLNPDSADELECIGIEKAYQIAREADLILYIFDCVEGLTERDQQLIRRLADNNHQSPLHIIANKSDLLAHTDDNSYLYVSTKTRYNLDKLEDLIKTSSNINQLEGDFALALNQRQSLCLKQAYTCLSDAKEEDLDILSASLVESVWHLSQINAQDTLNASEKLIDKVFQDFCIGK